MQDLNNIRVSWQMAVVVSALAVLPIAGAGLVSVLVESDQTGGRAVMVICGVLVVATLLLAVVAIRSRLASAPDREERAAILNRSRWASPAWRPPAP